MLDVMETGLLGPFGLILPINFVDAEREIAGTFG
jgi:hypothetical protein